MTNAKVLIERLAQHYDENGKQEHPIKVRSTRQYLMQLGIKPVERGAPLSVGTHPIVLMRRPADEEAKAA